MHPTKLVAIDPVPSSLDREHVQTYRHIDLGLMNYVSCRQSDISCRQSNNTDLISD